MPSATAAPDLRALAPAAAASLGGIMALLRQVVAMLFVRHPRLAVLSPALWIRINRAVRHFSLNMALLTAGRRPRLRRPGARDNTTTANSARRPSLPSTPGWLMAAANLHPRRHDLAACRIRLIALLAQPGTAELLAAAPAAAAALNPICRMLGLPSLRPPARQLAPAPPEPTPKRPRAIRPPALHPDPAPGTPCMDWLPWLPPRPAKPG